MELQVMIPSKASGYNESNAIAIEASDSFEQCAPEKQDAATAARNASRPNQQPPVWSTISDSHKTILILIAASAAAISPFSTSTYYPAVVALARSLDVSVSKINLTISTYQIFQGIAPAFIAAFADTYGRRPAYLLCFVVYLGANLGLALQNQYAALLVLRCLQSSGSSGTTTLAQAVTSDIATQAERGKYLAYGIIGSTVAPALAPVAGGLLTQHLGWRSIFWFLLILGGTICFLIFVFFPETSRSVVGDGSVPPHKWNKSVLQMLPGKKRSDRIVNLDRVEPRPPRLNLLTTLFLLRDKENFILCMGGGMLYAGYTSVTSIFASQLAERFGYNEVQTGLCYLPIAFGSLSAGVTTARLIDWNFRKQATKQGLTVTKNRQTDISNFDTEKARLAFAFPLILFSCALITAYSWQMQYRTSLAGILVTMFFLSNVLTGSLVSFAALLTDINRQNAAAIAAAMNFTRCLLSAGGVAAIGPLINSVGIGWAATIAAGIWMLTGEALFVVWWKGFEWRKKKMDTMEDNADTTGRNKC